MAMKDIFLIFAANSNMLHLFGGKNDFKNTFFCGRWASTFEFSENF